MSYFSRLTDIVTCNLTMILQEATDQQAALDQIIREIQDGVTGAHRSAATAARNLERIEGEIAEQTSQATLWLDRAKGYLNTGDENQARQSLIRKKEVEALIAGLEQQRTAATSTCKHLQTTLAALQARLHEAERRRHGAVETPVQQATYTPETDSPSPWGDIDQELADLKKQVGKQAS